MDKIIDSFNIYTCSDRGDATPNSTGDEFELNMNNAKIDIQKGQFFRLSLVNFNMFKSFTNVNKCNDRFLLHTTAGGVANNGQLTIPHGNYKSVHSLMNAFSKVLRDELLIRAKAVTGSTVDECDIDNKTPDTNDTAEGDSDNIMSFRLKFKDVAGADAAHGLTGIMIYCFDDYSTGMSDVYQLLGAKRIRGSPTIDPTDSLESMIIDGQTNPNEITVSGSFGGQRLTEPFIYLRTSLGNSTKNLETSSLSDAKITRGNVSEVHSSDIFAKIPVDVEFCHFDSQHGNEYFMNLHNMRHLTNINFNLTNSHGKKLHEVTSSEHADSGNLSFSMVLKVDIVEKNAPNERHTQEPNRGINPKFSNQIVTESGLIRD